jgi:hypothetical protein
MSALLLAAVSLPGWGQNRFALTTSQVAQTLSAGGIETTDEQVSLLAQVVATQPAPMLDVLSVEPLGGRLGVRHPDTRSLVKLACHQPGTCLPFYAIVNWPEGAVVPASGALGASLFAKSAASKTNGSVTMRAGTHATMVMDDSRSHIQVAVVTLESGIAGKKIRVASPDHKQVYVAEVVSANQLKRSY